MFSNKDYRQLPNSELKISPITLGTMTFGDQNSQTEAFQQLDYAVSSGINSIDVAELYPVPPKPDTYTKTETIVGEWLKNQYRDQLVISTKVAGPRRDLDWIRGGPKSLDQENITSALHASLKRLQTDYIDLLYLHWPERNVPMFGQYRFDPNDEVKNIQQIPWVSIESQLETLKKLTDSGKVRAIALSNEFPWGMMEFLRIAREKKLPLISALQNSYSLLNRTVEFGMTEVLFREKIGFLAYSPLAFGYLTGKYNKNPNANGRVNLFPGYAQRFNKPGVSEAVKKYALLAENFNLSLTELALKFVSQQWFVTSTIIGATNMDQLQQNLNAVTAKVLGPEILAEVENIHLSVMNPAP
jgi:aryl-alcohol dehydrogenase-like predicted oxidoreductase